MEKGGQQEKSGENINCFLLNEKYMLFGGKLKMNQ